MRKYRIDYLKYPHSTLLIPIISNLLLLLNEYDELHDDFDEDKFGTHYVVSKMKFNLTGLDYYGNNYDNIYITYLII
jgi:hypothetical protein